MKNEKKIQAGRSPSGACRVRGFVYLEISEPWTRAGFVQMQPVRVLTGLDAQVCVGFRRVCASTPKP